MKSIIKYVLLSGIRDRLYIGLFIALIIAISLSIFLGSTALVEQQQMSSAFIAGLSRSTIIVGMILFVVLSTSKAFENKEVEFILSKSIAREQFVLSYIVGFFLAALLILIPLILAISLLIKINKLGLVIWSLSLIFELLIMISFAFLASLILKNSFSAIVASLGFYILARLMGMFVMAINLPHNFGEIKLDFAEHFFATLLKILSAIFPRLDLFGQSEWLFYGISDFSNFKIILAQSLIYIPLMIFMAFHDFKKKQF